MKKAALFKNWGTFKKGMDAESIQISFANHLEYSLSKDQYTATFRDLYHALALTARDRMVERWIRTQQMYHDHDVKRIYYLSAEYLMGRALINNLINLGMYEEVKEAMNQINVDLDEVAEQEPDMGLGNGGDRADLQETYCQSSWCGSPSPTAVYGLVDAGKRVYRSNLQESGL